MKIPDPIFDCKVIEGQGRKTIQYAPGDRDGIIRWIQTFKVGTRLEHIIRKRKKKRTSDQNRYYWGVVIPILADYFGHDNPEDMHEELKELFNPIESKVKPGKIIGGSTTKMSTEEFYVGETSYVERICRWAAMEYQIYIPPPKKRDKNAKK